MRDRPTTLAKTTRPSGAAALRRPRLFRLLDRARHRPVVWVPGPPGAGKTTLVASYLEARRLPHLWYQLDAGDADRATFFYYLRLAAAKAAPRRRPLPLLTPEYLAGLSTFARRYFQDLFGRLKTPFVVVFDNYQDVPAGSTFHEVLREGLAQVPEGGSVVVISRGGPPPSLARLRATETMAVVDEEALRLTPAESRGIVRLRAPRQVPSKTICRLRGRRDGARAGRPPEDAASRLRTARRGRGRHPGAPRQRVGGARGRGPVLRDPAALV